MFKMFLLILILFSVSVNALEIDEKLTLRILRVSDSKKTMLINRGIEDGLAEGDHAKFFVTSGVVARGTVVKVSPTRSVWSVYRLVSPEYIKEDTVLNLKIASAVKVTDDESKMISKEPDVAKDVKMDKLDIPLSEGADDVDKTKEKDELLSVAVTEAPVSLLLRNFEVWGNFNLSMLTGTASPTNGAATTEANEQVIHTMVGGEYYFTNEASWYSRFSLAPMLNYSKNSFSSPIGTSIDSTLVEFGGSVYWHPFTRPSSPNEFIPFFDFGLTKGSMSVTSKTYNSVAANGTSVSISSSGASGSFLVGLGCKYYFSNAFGFRLLLDYVSTTASFDPTPEANNAGFDFKQGGPKLFLGMSYRW